MSNKILDLRPSVYKDCVEDDSKEDEGPSAKAPGHIITALEANHVILLYGKRGLSRIDGRKDGKGKRDAKFKPPLHDREEQGRVNGEFYHTIQLLDIVDGKIGHLPGDHIVQENDDTYSKDENCDAGKIEECRPAPGYQSHNCQGNGQRAKRRDEE